jgi:CDP-diacylglycerol--glycerol-3-phosphate 3-phosphatidyltransferase
MAGWKVFLMTVDDRTSPKTFTDFLRVKFKGVLDAIAGFLNGIGLYPNTMTLIGLLGNVAGAYLLATGHITWGGVVILLMAPIDALDGSMARLRGTPTAFGGFLDSVTDRYSELFTFGGLLYYFVNHGDLVACLLVYIAAAGSILVSYSRARAETLGFEAKVGMLTRVERYIILVPCLIFNIPLVALWLLAIFTNITALQRIWHVRSQAVSKDHQNSSSQ